MFKKSRQKIVTVIMAVLIFPLVGTLCVIYSSSYIEVYRRNQDMLAHHIELHEQRTMTGFTGLPNNDFEPEYAPDYDDDVSFQLSTFYTVIISHKGIVLDIDNIGTGYSNEELENIAQSVINSKKQGTTGSLIYCYEEYEDYTLIAFMDNAIMQESITTLFRYTLIFGSIAILFMFILARIVARKIVQPLEESYQRQRQFISDAGHELKTPVSVVSANAEMLEHQIGSNQWLANIQYENTRMSVLVTQLLELARTEQIAPEMSAVDLSRLVMGEALPFETVAYEHGLRLESMISENIRVTGNTLQLSQLTSILIDNGIRHSASGGTVQITLTAVKDVALLSICNEGAPIPKEQQDLLFERFYRMDESRNSNDNHYGLGLAIAKAIVTTHKGCINICCHNGFVEFRVQIPLL